MYGDLGNKLVLQAKRTQNLAHLPPYQAEIVRAVTREVRDLDKDVAELLAPYQGTFDPAEHQSTACTLLVSSGDGSTSSLSPQEEEYVRSYGDLLAAYKGQWTDIDLTGSLEPPRDLFIDVRVLKDAGEIQTEYGSITLTKNSQFYVRQGDVERLITQGYLQKLD
ncbi:hypothetical protein VdG1_01347 [Verticillium dahliae VDG1]|nr:hypothetical protein VdG1_01347 [Verticillium dahliae VDG1]